MIDELARKNIDILATAVNHNRKNIILFGFITALNLLGIVILIIQ